MWFARLDDGYLFGGLTRQCVDTLKGVPMLVESQDPRVRERLLPEPYDDQEADAQWRRHAVPELERLFASRLHMVRKDLGAMQVLKDTDSWILQVPDGHTNAWLATLNAARLSLYVLNDLAPELMEREGVEKANPKQQEALQRIHFLAEMQCVLLGDFDGEAGEPPGEPDDPPPDQDGRNN
jgi:hypothetical protein